MEGVAVLSHIVLNVAVDICTPSFICRLRSTPLWRPLPFVKILPGENFLQQFYLLVSTATLFMHARAFSHMGTHSAYPEGKNPLRYTWARIKQQQETYT